jgi:muramoyltetrapeptide carboxypeptidase
MSPRAPSPLKPKDRVAVVAPSGPFDREAFDAGLKLIAARYTPVFTERLFERTRYTAGTDEARLAELQGALDDDSLAAVFVARGGYGAMRLLGRLEFAGRTPKPLVGFSDVTALHCAAQAAGWRTVHAPVLTQLGKQPPEVVQRLFDLLEGREVAPLPATTCLVPGAAEGPLFGGNLSVFTRLVGTPFLPRLTGGVLLLEDVAERPYRLDRMWTHLRLAGLFDGVIGIALGDFTTCDEPGGDHTALDVLKDLARETGLPCAAGFRIGHDAVNQPVVLGARAKLDALRLSLTSTEPLAGPS